jgi:hypothetical protein
MSVNRKETNMSSERLERAKQLYDEFNKHNIPGILDLLDPEIVWTSFGPDFATAVGVTGSPRPTRPSSTSIMIDALVSAFVCEAIRNKVSTRIGRLASRSAQPSAFS